LLYKVAIHLPLIRWAILSENVNQSYCREKKDMKRVKKVLPVLICSLLVMGFMACGEEGDEGWSDNPKDAVTPEGTRTLQDLPDAELKKVLAATVVEIQLARPAGIKQVLAQMETDLKAQGIDTSSLAKLSDSNMCSKDASGKVTCRPLPGMDTGTTTKTGDVVTQDQLLSKSEQQKYYKCPLLAPGQKGTSCEKMAEAVAAKVAGAISANKSKMEAYIASKYKDLAKVGQQFILAWKHTATQYGSTLATLYATHELKAAAQCDTKANVYEVAYNLGVTQGVKIVLSLRAWALSQVTSCVVNTDAIAQQVKASALAKVTAYMKEHGVCKTEDISTLSDAYKQAEIKRESGIKKGISTQVQILRNELFQRRQTAPCGGGGGGDPLVIDLDNDGLTLTANRVSFDLLGDGTQQRTTWAGAREGFLAMDRDGDGAITSVNELLADKGNCAGRACYDGVESVRALDSNKDGRVDAADPAYASLLVWVDSNQDGISQPGEISTLAGNGIRAITLQVRSEAVRHAGGTVLRSVGLVTDNGPRRAYDVWFRVRLGMENLSALLPR